MSYEPFCYRAHQNLPLSPGDRDDDNVDCFFDGLQQGEPAEQTTAPDSAPPSPSPSPPLERRSVSAHSVLQTCDPPLEMLTVAVRNTHLGLRRAASGDELSQGRAPRRPPPPLPAPAYVSLAEAIYHMQKDTPERFHSTSRKLEKRALDAALAKRKGVGVGVGIGVGRDATVPQSPVLLSKARARKSHALSREELEEIEYREMKKRQVRAQPVPRAVLLGGPLPAVPRRPPTRPEPFELTAARKKPAEKAPETKAFAARPAPRHIFERPFVVRKAEKPVTEPRSPNVRRADPKRLVARSLENVGRRDVAHVGVPISQKLTLKRPCTPRPFSFELRDRERQQRKEAELRRVLEAERKMREFHANPVPALVRKKFAPAARRDDKENAPEKSAVEFVARPPLVLSKAPFVPAKSERPVLTACPLRLATETRAREREEFDRKVKRNEEMNEMYRKRLESERRTEEEIKTAELRQKLVHKANPVRNYQFLEIKPSNLPLTLPLTPNFAHKKH